jgi:hypothetical protein
MDAMVSLKDARDYLLNLPFNSVASVNMRANEDKMIEPSEATEISNYGFVLLLKLVDLMERLDLPHKRRVTGFYFNQNLSTRVH